MYVVVIDRDKIYYNFVMPFHYEIENINVFMKECNSLCFKVMLVINLYWVDVEHVLLCRKYANEFDSCFQVSNSNKDIFEIL